MWLPDKFVQIPLSFSTSSTFSTRQLSSVPNLSTYSVCKAKTLFEWQFRKHLLLPEKDLRGSAPNSKEQITYFSQAPT